MEHVQPSCLAILLRAPSFGTETEIVIFKSDADVRRICCGMVCGMSCILRSKEVSRYPSLGFKYLLADLGSRSAPLCVVRVKGKLSPPAEVSGTLNSIIS